MDFHKLISRYRQLDGLRLVWQYTKLGILPVVIKGVVRCVAKRQTFKAIYPVVQKRVEPYLVKRYSSKVQEIKKFNGSRELEQEHPKVIWWC